MKNALSNLVDSRLFLIAIAIIAAIVLVIVVVATFSLLRSENKKEHSTRPKDEINSIPPVEKSWLLRHPRKLDICVAQEDQSQAQGWNTSMTSTSSWRRLADGGRPENLFSHFSGVGRHEGSPMWILNKTPGSQVDGNRVVIPHQISSSRRPSRDAVPTGGSPRWGRRRFPSNLPRRGRRKEHLLMLEI